MSEFQEIKIKCEYNSCEVEEEMDIKPFANLSEDHYRLTKQEEVFYTIKFNDYPDNSNTPNYADCLDTENFEKIVPKIENDCDSNNSEPSTSSGRTSSFRTVKEWNPTTRLGRMVKNKKYTSIKEIRKNDLTISERSIVNFLLGPSLSFEVLYVKPLFDELSDLRGYVSCACVGDRNGHFGYSIKYDALRDISVQESINRAMINVHSIKRLSYIVNNKKMYTVAVPVTGYSGIVIIKILPNFSEEKFYISNYYVRSMLSLAGIDNCIVKIIGYEPFFGKVLLATFRALMNLYDNE